MRARYGVNARSHTQPREFASNENADGECVYQGVSRSPDKTGAASLRRRLALGKARLRLKRRRRERVHRWAIRDTAVRRSAAVHPVGHFLKKTRAVIRPVNSALPAPAPVVRVFRLKTRISRERRDSL